MQVAIHFSALSSFRTVRESRIADRSSDCQAAQGCVATAPTTWDPTRARSVPALFAVRSAGGDEDRSEPRRVDRTPPHATARRDSPSRNRFEWRYPEMRHHIFNIRMMSAARIRSLAAVASVVALALFCTQAVQAAENPDPSLLGVSRSFIEANGRPAAITLSARGVNQNGAQQIPKSGFDLINDGVKGAVLLRGIRTVPNRTCDGLSDDAFFFVQVAGRPGDADGNGVFNTNTDPCATPRGNNPAKPRVIDGNTGHV